jgi:hypothetical protein
LAIQQKGVIMEALVIGFIVFVVIAFLFIERQFKRSHKIFANKIQQKIIYEFSIFDSFVTRTREVLKTNSAYCDQICCNQEEIDTLKAEIDEYLAKRP